MKIKFVGQKKCCYFTILFETKQPKTIPMKKIFTLISILSVSITGLWAQCVCTPNPGFESWTHTSTILATYDTPDNWNCANSSTGSTGVITVLKATSAHSGSFAAELITKQIPAPFSQLVPGMITTGTINTTSQTITGGIAYSLRPDSITGWYKYTPQGGENGIIQFILFGSAANNTDTVAIATFITPTTTVGTYTRFSTQLVYRSANTVANSMWIIASSKNDGLASSVGSTLYVDDLGLVINPASGVIEQNMSEISVGPNPATDHFEIKNPLNTNVIFILYDVTGRKVAEEKIGKTTNIISVNSFPNGIYSYALTDESYKAIKGGKLIIKK